MTAFEELEMKSQAKRTAIEQCIIDAAKLEDMRDGDTTLMEKAAEELAELVEYKNLYNQTAKELNAANHKLSQIKNIYSKGMNERDD